MFLTNVAWLYLIQLGMTHLRRHLSYNTCLLTNSQYKNPSYLQPNDFILVNPLKQKSWGTGTTGIQSLTTIISVLSLVTTIIVLMQL